MKKPKIIVVGGGLAGLMAVIKVAEAGWPVQLFSVVPVRRSGSVLAQGGINAALDAKREGDSPEVHFQETITAGDFLANQELPRQMCFKAPEIISLFDRMGVMFNRTPEGWINFRRVGGTHSMGGAKYCRTAYAGHTTGQQLLYALDEQVRRFEAEGLVEKFEGWEFLSIIKDDRMAGRDVCRGIVAMHLATQEVKAFPASAVIVSTGGLGLVFGRSTNSVLSNGSAASAVYQQGAWYANGEFIQVHPTTIPGEDKYRMISEAARDEGGRLWVYRDGKPWYFLEEWHQGNQVPGNLVCRSIHKVIHELGLGIDGGSMVYLDISHLPEEILQRRLKGVVETCEKFTAENPRKVPIKVAPAAHYSMGGLWVDDDHMTSIPGVLAAGECDYQYHGADRLGGNALLSCVYGGMKAGITAVHHAAGLEKGEADPAIFSEGVKRQWGINQEIIDRSGNENPHKLHQELGEWMTEHATVVRYNDKLKKTDEKIQELKLKMKKISLTDRGNWANRELVFARQLHNMLELTRVIVLGALLRDESRGAHYKPEFPERDDRNFLKTTKASWTPNGPKIEYEDVNLKYIKPEWKKSTSK
ncbi:MAG: succinate dehydrogenase (quinone) flavoprotein subunit [Deltaproteobacteria bacterium]|nr:succinate dehydrogenase (quinone) flavoprotein subunit [Deltaproteobacteria bacterium]